MNWVVPFPLFGAGGFSEEEAPAARTALDVLAESAAWWEADDASNTVVADAFSQLTDLSGNGNHLTQATVSLRPARLDTAGVISAEFDGADDLMAVAAPTAVLANNYATGGTVVVVHRPDSTGEVATFGFGRIYDKSGDDNENIFMTASGADPLIAVRFAHVTADPQWQTTNAVALAKMLLDVRYDKSDGSAAEPIVGINGTDMAVGTGLTESTSPSGAGVSVAGASIVIGNRTEGDRAYDGGFYALAFWSSILSDADMALIRAYFADKYGITIA